MISSAEVLEIQEALVKRQVQENPGCSIHIEPYFDNGVLLFKISVTHPSASARVDAEATPLAGQKCPACASRKRSHRSGRDGRGGSSAHQPPRPQRPRGATPASASAPKQAAPSAARSRGRRQTPCMLRRKQRRAEMQLAARASEPQGSLVPAARPTAQEAPAQVALTPSGRKRHLDGDVVQPAQQSLGDGAAAIALLAVAAGSVGPGLGRRVQGGGAAVVPWGCPAGQG